MDYDQDKVDDYTLALMCLVLHEDQYGVRAWNGFDWDTLNRLREKGTISNPKGKAKSVGMSDAGVERAQALFETVFGLQDSKPRAR